MLVDVLAVVSDCYINNVASSIVYRVVVGVNKATIRLDIKCLVTCDNLSVEVRLYLYCVALNKCLTSLVVTLRLNALNLAKKRTKELAEAYEVVYNNIVLAILLNDLYNILSLTLLLAPLSDELAVTHVRLLYILTKLDTRKLCLHTIHDILAVLCPCNVECGDKTNLNELLVAEVIECEEVCTCLLEC